MNDSENVQSKIRRGYGIEKIPILRSFARRSKLSGTS